MTSLDVNIHLGQHLFCFVIIFLGKLHLDLLYGFCPFVDCPLTLIYLALVITQVRHLKSGSLFPNKKSILVLQNYKDAIVFVTHFLLWNPTCLLQPSIVSIP